MIPIFGGKLALGQSLKNVLVGKKISSSFHLPASVFHLTQWIESIDCYCANKTIYQLLLVSVCVK